jgi:hypothetical protein
LGITIGAIALVVLWYRMKTVFKRRKKNKNFVEQQRQLSSPSTNNNNNNHSTAPRYASSDMLGSIHSTQLISNKSQSQALIAPASPPTTVYKNVEALANNDPIQTYPDQENQQQQQEQQPNLTNDTTTELQAVTEC